MQPFSPRVRKASPEIVTKESDDEQSRNQSLRREAGASYHFGDVTAFSELASRSAGYSFAQTLSRSSVR